MIWIWIYWPIFITRHLIPWFLQLLHPSNVIQRHQSQATKPGCSCRAQKKVVFWRASKVWTQSHKNTHTHTRITHTLFSFYSGWNEWSYMNIEHDLSFLTGVWYCGPFFRSLRDVVHTTKWKQVSHPRFASFWNATVEQTAYFDSDSLCVFDNPAGNFCFQFANAISDRSAAPHNNRITVFLMESMRRKCT